VEEIDREAFRGDVEVVVLPEELRVSGSSLAEELRLLLVRFLEDRFEDFEGGGEAVALLVEDARGGEEADIAGAGELLWCAVGRVVLGRSKGGDRDDCVERVGDDVFVGYDQAEVEVLEDFDLGDAG
jgi:hypothetical protein